jgi:manganese-dependent inorganic pyrophosphatase
MRQGRHNCASKQFKMSEVLVIGHRNPDTDAICSAIGYAEFKRRTGMANVVAARCGDTNDRIDFVLKAFSVPPPRFVADVSPKVRDVMQTNIASATPNTTVAEALALMDERNIRVLPVLDQERRCKGLLSLFKISKFFFPAANRLVDSRRVLGTVRNLARTLGGKLLFATEPDREEDLILMVGAMTVESFAKRLQGYPRERLLVVVGDRWDIQNLAIRERVRLVVVTGGLPVEEATLEAARRNEVSIILSPHDSATTAQLCRAAITVDHMIHEHFLSFKGEEPLAAMQRLARESQFQAFPVVDESGRMVGILSKSDFLKKVERQLILVDHNELSQAVQGADQVEILEIIDHHRIGALTTHQPILFRNEPVGSTSTIVADCFFRYNVEMPKSIAGLLLAGLVSDTLNLTSPTTTQHDAEILARLEQIAEVSATEFTEKLFNSGSVLTSKPASQAIATDCKEYEERGCRFSVAQIEEIGFDQFWKRKADVFAALEGYRAQKGYFFSALLVTDVVMQTSLLLIAGSDSLVRQIDHPKLENGIYELNGVVSRKKQLLPYLTHCLQKIG